MVVTEVNLMTKVSFFLPQPVSAIAAAQNVTKSIFANFIMSPLSVLMSVYVMSFLRNVLHSTLILIQAQVFLSTLLVCQFSNPSPCQAQ